MTEVETVTRSTAVPGRVLASERDLDLLRLVGEQCAVTEAQLARAAGRSVHTARWIRRRWQRAGLARCAQVIAGRPALVWLTGRGQRVAGLDYRLWRPAALGRIAHIVATTEARLLVTARRPGVVWMCERELMRDQRRAGSHAHRPDAEALVEEGTAAVEVELHPKGRARFERIVLELSSRYPAVWYLAPAELRARLATWAEDAALTRVHVIELPDPWRSP